MPQAEMDSPYLLFKAVVRMAQNVDQSPYHADKLLWLIGNGRFYNHPHVGNGGRIGQHRDEFVALVKSRVGLPGTANHAE